MLNSRPVGRRASVNREKGTGGYVRHTLGAQAHSWPFLRECLRKDLPFRPRIEVFADPVMLRILECHGHEVELYGQFAWVVIANVS